MKKALVWFRRDLRVHDNPALFHACANAAEGVIAVFILTPEQWKKHDDAPAKIDFWLRCLKPLSESLAALNIPLLIRKTSTFDGCADVICRLAKKYQSDSVFVNREYEVNEVSRDLKTETSLARIGVSMRHFHDRVIVPPEDVRTGDGRIYSVFTPFRRVWEPLAFDNLKVLRKPKKQKETNVPLSRVPGRVEGFAAQGPSAELWPAGEREAQRRLRKFCKRISLYGDERDFPALDGTSVLSPYLTAGAISPRQCLAAALKTGNYEIGKKSGASVWISELSWRDFYTHVLVGFPRVSKHLPFKPKTDQIAWRHQESELLAWQTGQTGFPLVDAGMRQLKQTGWMHNRLRMVVAMFLTKILLIDWRLGEACFMKNLIDGDLAANNGGWQWSASTGTDAVPYFRIFNPFSQSKRFDPDGTFIKTYCPELENIPASRLHDLDKFAAAARECNYPKYIVDYKAGRQRTLAAFKAIVG